MHTRFFVKGVVGVIGDKPQISVAVAVGVLAYLVVGERLVEFRLPVDSRIRPHIGV